MLRVRVSKKRVIIGLTIVIAITIIATLGIGGVKVVNANKISSSLELGIKYLTEGKYDKAKEEFLKVTSIDNTHEEGIELIELTDDYVELENLYESKKYVLALELVNKIKENKYLEYIEGRVNELSAYIEEKVKIINEINNIDGQIDELINENKYEEAISLINEYLEQDLEEEYSNKLNILMDKVNDSKSSYDEEKQKIAEEMRLEEERKAEEERKREEELAKQQEENKKEESTTNSGSSDLGYNSVNGSIYQLEAAEMALAVVRRDHPGYGPHYFERGLVTDGEWRWAFVFLKLEDPNATSIEDSNIIGQVGYTVNATTGEVKQEDWLVQ
ncbi:hypothetical protein [Paraclostridium bifermentans]|jgi:tetratricopeptide (TPR) repeat protein|uniref:hypothetical protein n=1 Tax=Paraclostridium bifermentans TaxID=1490 RepID=UPI0018A0D3CF|nr:hypothetical protein [Paraclostridium bifermentans]